MYPLTCHAGFNVPARAGKFEIVGFTALADQTDQDTEFAIIDDINIKKNQDQATAAYKAGLIIADLDQPCEIKKVLCHEKIYEGDGGPYDATIKWFPPETVKTRYDISLFFSNIKQGSLCLYVK